MAALLVAEKPGESEGAGDSDDAEMMAAEDCAGLMGAKDPSAAAAALIDAIRACIAKSRKGGYSK